ncbi:Piezo-type mechanosensitive ion channel component 1 [Manis javanica]|nr:Piezo-type mechanosensitive ion channel component 1 [Manis javanica]
MRDKEKSSRLKRADPAGLVRTSPRASTRGPSTVLRATLGSFRKALLGKRWVYICSARFLVSFSGSKSYFGNFRRGT